MHPVIAKNNYLEVLSKSLQEVHEFFTGQLAPARGERLVVVEQDGLYASFLELVVVDILY